MWSAFWAEGSDVAEGSIAATVPLGSCWLGSWGSVLGDAAVFGSASRLVSDFEAGSTAWVSWC